VAKTPLRIDVGLSDSAKVAIEGVVRDAARDLLVDFADWLADKGALEISDPARRRRLADQYLEEAKDHG